MKTKSILGISLAAFFAIAMTGIAHAGIGVPDYAIVEDADVIPNDDDGFIYSINATGPIPQVDEDKEIGALDFEAPAFGYAWLNVVSLEPVEIDFTGATIHPEVIDSRQNPENWHPHTGTLVVVDGTLCVGDLQSPHAGIAITDKQIRVNMPEKWAEVTPDNWDAATAFILIPNEDCPNPLDTNLPGKGLKPNQFGVPLQFGLEVIPLPFDD